MIPERRLYERIVRLKKGSESFSPSFREGYLAALDAVMDICCDLEEEEAIRRQEEGLKAIYDQMEEEGYI